MPETVSRCWRSVDSTVVTAFVFLFSLAARSVIVPMIKPVAPDIAIIASIGGALANKPENNNGNENIFCVPVADELPDFVNVCGKDVNQYSKRSDLHAEELPSLLPSFDQNGILIIGLQFFARFHLPSHR